MSRLVLKLAPVETHDAIYLDVWDSQGRPVRIAVESLEKMPLRLGLVAPLSVKVLRAKVLATIEGVDRQTLRHQTEAAAK